MKPRLSLKMLYRSPVRTVLTFILLAAVTFALFSQVMEYSVAKREMEKAVAEYKGMGSVINGEFKSEMNVVFAYMFADERVANHVLPEQFETRWRELGYENLTQEQINAITDMPYVSHVDTRYLTAGVTEYRRIDIDWGRYEYTHNCVIEATIKGIQDDGTIIAEDVELVGGEPISPGISNFGKDPIGIVPEPLGYAYAMQQQSERDALYYFYGPTNRTVSFASEKTKYGKSKYGTDYTEDLVWGERYVFVLRYEDYLVPRPDIYPYYLTDVFSYGQCEAVYPLKGEPENYLETEKFAPLREYIEIIETDMYTYDMVYTYDMDSIRYFSDGTMGISEGRELKPEDTENGNNVCVVNHDFAQEYGLEIGDKITVDLGNKLFEYNYQAGAIAAVKERMSTSYTTAELEIVGIFKDTRNKYIVAEDDDAAWGYGKNTIFIPQHLLNVEESELQNHKVYPQEFGFVVGNAWELPAFKEEVLPKFEELGLEVTFVDGGFGEILTAFKETERIALIKIAILLFAIIVITWFVSMLYIVGRRRDYAVMRLLGTSKGRASRSLLLPLGVIAVAAVVVGSLAAYVYTLGNIGGNASLAVLSEFEIDLTISPYVIIACVVGEIVLTVLLALLLLAVIGRKSPLELMQTGTQKGKKRRKKKKTVYTPEPQEPIVLGEWESIERPVHDGKNRSAQFMRRYAMRHIKRTLGKALMFIIVSALLINVVGQLLVMKTSYVDIFEGTEIVSKYAGFLNIAYVQDLIASGYVRDVYYNSNQTVDIDRRQSFIFVNNNPYKLAAEMGYEDFEITWLDGYDISSMYTMNTFVVMGEDIMAERGYELGDTVEFSKQGWYDMVVSAEIRNYNMSNFGDYTEEEIMEMCREAIMKRYKTKMNEFIIIGVASDAQNITGQHIYTPGCDEVVAGYGKLVIPPEVTAVLADNYKAEEYREFGMSLAGKNLTGEIAFIMDTSKIENVRNNIDLMNMLYPIMVAAVLVIGAFLCGMLIVQTSKDIAIMRVLGTPKRKVRAIMVIEHMVLCVFGIVLAGIVLAIRGVFADMLIVFGMYILVIFLASLISAAAASRKSPLALLQTKE
ncbi:MAG: ABC transporter permease [Oscillospiraceae bacterium]|nr:ABC transporter permease [Oscillospiraceae bacterium]